MASVKKCSRINLAFVAVRMWKKTGKASWLGVQQVFENDKRWTSLKRMDKIYPDSILLHCNLSGLQPQTIARMKAIIAAVIQTNNSMKKVVALLVTPKPAKSSSASATSSRVDVAKFMEIREANSNSKNQASSADAFNEYAQKYGVQLTASQRNTFIKQLVQTNKCIKTKLRGNNLKILSTTNTTNTTTTTTNW